MTNTNGRSTMVHVRVPHDLLAAIDSAAGPGQRSAWLLDAARHRIAASEALQGDFGMPEPVQAPAVTRQQLQANARTTR